MVMREGDEVPSNLQWTPHALHHWLPYIPETAATEPTPSMVRAYVGMVANNDDDGDGDNGDDDDDGDGDDDDDDGDDDHHHQHHHHFNHYIAGGWPKHLYFSESTQGEWSDEYQHERV